METTRQPGAVNANPTAPGPSRPAIVLAGVCKSYGGQTVVSDVDLTVAEGEFVSIVGPSGCGKTTLLRLIAGFEQPDSGHITIGGRRMEGVPTYLRNTAIVVQNFALFRNMTVQQNVEFGLAMRGLNKRERSARAVAMLELVGLTGLGARRVDQLSGGQRQRVALARALVVEPDVLLLDEPLGALDANLRLRMQGELQGLQRSLGITFVHVTGNQGEAMAMADRMVVMERGHVVQQGPPLQVFRAPATRFVARFMGNNNILDGHVTHVEAGSDMGTVLGPLGTFRAKVDGARAGASGGLIVRTDRLHFIEGEADGVENSVEGVIAGEEFAGSLVTSFVEVATGDLLRVERHQSVYRPTDTRLTDRVVLGWSAANTRFVPDTPVHHGERTVSVEEAGG